MLKLLTRGAAVVVLAGLALGATAAPSAAAVYGYQAPGVHVTIGAGPVHHRRSRWVQVCHTHWHHHHRVQECHMERVWR